MINKLKCKINSKLTTEKKIILIEILELIYDGKTIEYVSYSVNYSERTIRRIVKSGLNMTFNEIYYYFLVSKKLGDT